ncbi:MAG: SRPBCC family protein [Pseudomonadota bacterium]
MKSAEKIDDQTVRFKRLFDASKEQVWSYLVEGEKRSMWLCGGEWELKPGGRAPMHFDNPSLSRADDLPPPRYADETGSVIHEGQIQQIDAPHRLVLLWVEHDGSRSEVTFELIEQEEKTLLTLTHCKLTSEDMLSGVSAGWHAHLDIWLAVVSGETPPSFWSRFNRLATDVYAHDIGSDA